VWDKAIREITARKFLRDANADVLQPLRRNSKAWKEDLQRKGTLEQTLADGAPKE